MQHQPLLLDQLPDTHLLSKIPSKPTPEQAHIQAENFHYGKNGYPIAITKALHWYLFAAKGGHKPSMMVLGDLFMDGPDSTPANAAVGVAWYRKLTQLNDPIALCKYAHCLEKGYGLPKSLHLAQSWYLKAAALGNIQAHHYLGLLYLDTHQLSKAQIQFESVLMHFEKSPPESKASPQQFFIDSMYQIAKLNIIKVVFEHAEKHVDTYISTLTPSAKTQKNISPSPSMFLHLQKVVNFKKILDSKQKNPLITRALDLLETLVDTYKHSQSYVLLGSCCLVSGNNEKAQKLFQAGLPNSFCQFQVAQSYMERAKKNLNDPSNLKLLNEAVQMLIEAAKNKNVDSCLALADCYKNGFGVVQDNQVYGIYLEISANLGSPLGYYRFGIYLFKQFMKDKSAQTLLKSRRWLVLAKNHFPNDPKIEPYLSKANALLGINPNHQAETAFPTFEGEDKVENIDQQSQTLLNLLNFDTVFQMTMSNNLNDLHFIASKLLEEEEEEDDDE